MEKLAEMIARLLADGVDPNRLIGFVPGPDLPVLEGHSMHCSGVTLLAEIKGDRIVEFDKHLPYAFLHVEATTLPRSAVAVINKGDFKNVWTIHESGWFGKVFG